MSETKMVVPVFDSQCICTAKVSYGTHMDCCGNLDTAYCAEKNGFRCKGHWPQDETMTERQFLDYVRATDRLSNPYQRELDFFTDAMRYKLIKNAHKGRWEDLNLNTALTLLKDEVAELEEAIKAGSQIDIIMEGADIGNFAMIVTNIAVTEAAKRGGK